MTVIVPVIGSGLIRDGEAIEQRDFTSVIGLHRTLASIDVDANGQMYLVNVFKGNVHRIVSAD